MTNTMRDRSVFKALPTVLIVFSVILTSCGPLGNIADRIGLGSSGKSEAAREGLFAGAGGGGEAGEVVYLEGTVSLNGAPASVGDTVADGDVLITGEGALVEMEFGEYRILRATENTRLSVDSRERTMKLETGALAVVQSKTRKLTRKRPWEVETPTTIAAVRGTLYYTSVEDADTTYFCLCNGRIHLEDEAGFIDLEAKHHSAVRARRVGGEIVYEDAPMLYHDDAGMESLADSVYVPVDWTRIPD